MRTSRDVPAFNPPLKQSSTPTTRNNHHALSPHVSTAATSEPSLSININPSLPSSSSSPSASIISPSQPDHTTTTSVAAAAVARMGLSNLSDTSSNPPPPPSPLPQATSSATLSPTPLSAALSPSASPSARHDDRTCTNRDRLRSTTSTLAGSASTSSATLAPSGSTSARAGLTAVGRVASRVRLSFSSKARTSDDYSNLWSSRARLGRLRTGGVAESLRAAGYRDREDESIDVNASPWGVGRPTQRKTYAQQQQQQHKAVQQQSPPSPSSSLSASPPQQQQQQQQEQEQQQHRRQQHQQQQQDRPRMNGAQFQYPGQRQRQRQVYGHVQQDYQKPFKTHPQQQPARMSLDNAFFTALVSSHSPSKHHDGNDDNEDDNIKHEHGNNIHGGNASTPSSVTLSSPPSHTGLPHLHDFPVVSSPSPSASPASLAVISDSSPAHHCSPSRALQQLHIVESPTYNNNTPSSNPNNQRLHATLSSDSVSPRIFNNNEQQRQQLQRTVVPQQPSATTTTEKTPRVNPFKRELRNGIFVPSNVGQDKSAEKGSPPDLTLPELGPRQKHKKSVSMCILEHQETISLLNDDDAQDAVQVDDEFASDVHNVDSSLFRAPVYQYMRTTSLPHEYDYDREEDQTEFDNDDDKEENKSRRHQDDHHHKQSQNSKSTSTYTPSTSSTTTTTTTSTVTAATNNNTNSPCNNFNNLCKQRFPKSPPPQSIFRSLGLMRHKPRAKPFGKDNHNINLGAKLTRCRSGSFDNKQDQQHQHQHQHQPGSYSFGRNGMGGGRTRSGWLTSLIGSLHGNVGHGHDSNSPNAGGGMPPASSSSNAKMSRYDLLGRKKSRDRDRDRDRDMTVNQAVNKTNNNVDEQQCHIQQQHQPQEQPQVQPLPHPNPIPSRKQEVPQRKTEDKRKKDVSELDFVDDELYDSDEDEIGAQPDVIVPSLARDDFVTYQTNQRRKGKERNKPRISMMWM